ncbi:lysoplasmalogenase family protein [uncultured Lacinutrix sp.]|uniref:lysoplasmalogenase family protein n=1 Tax=uncultured Lacinutrix sp. TaxID=574032 RepID=UPI0026386376|nr:lysoplasmalogenase family protein [uncultured Lacinutrix sp.]
MKIVFTNKIYFSILFFIFLSLDIYVKLNLEAVPYRLITKPLIVLSLLYFFIVNNSKTQEKWHYIIVALLSFLIGDILLIFYKIIPIYILGLILLMIGKLCYAKCFSNERDFNVFKLLPFFILCFAYMVFIMVLVLNKLGAFFFPTLLYLFSCLIVMLFAYLRKGDVNKRSYYTVLIGVTFAILCDSISVIQSFYYEEFPYQKFLIMLFYGLSQYFIIMGLVEEKSKEKSKAIKRDVILS